MDGEAIGDERDAQAREPVLVLGGETKEDIDVGPYGRFGNTEVFRRGTIRGGLGAVTL